MAEFLGRKRHRRYAHAGGTEQNRKKADGRDQLQKTQPRRANLPGDIYVKLD